MKQTTLKLSVLMLFLLAGSTFIIRSSHAQQQADKSVEQVRKNIQVLKGMPDSQLIPVMNFISTSLGVNCAYCHVRVGEDWDFAKDDKPTKATARKMMLMQFEINKNNRDILGGGVTCYTCHKGQTEPRGLPQLPITPPANAAAGGPGAGGPRPPAAALPTVDQVLDKFVQAIGGKAAFEKLHSREMKGVQIVAGGTEIPIEGYQEAPNKIVMIGTVPNLGVNITGYNGTVGWTKNARGQRELSGALLEQVKRSADFYGNLRLKETHPDLRVVGRSKIGDHEVYVLQSKVSDTRTERFYFDAQTGLLLRIQSITQTLLARIPDQTDFEDYRDVDGVKLPFTIRQSSIDPRSDWTRKYTEIKHNVTVDESKFNPPPAQATASPK